MSGSNTTTDSEQDSAEDHATSSSESHSSAEEDEDENENAEFMINIENPDALVRFIFFFMLKKSKKLVKLWAICFIFLFLSLITGLILIVFYNFFNPFSHVIHFNIFFLNKLFPEF